MVVMDVKRAVFTGQMSPANLNNKVEEWSEKMAVSGTFVDHTWFEMAAQMLDSDVVVIPLHAAEGDPCHIIPAGLLCHSGYGAVRHGQNLPIFIGNCCNIIIVIIIIIIIILSGYFEDDKHSDGHFQSVVPFQDSAILQQLRDQGGPDVAAILDLPQYTGQYIPVLFHNFDHIKCNKDNLFHVFTVSTLSSFQELLILQCRVRRTVQET